LIPFRPGEKDRLQRFDAQLLGRLDHGLGVVDQGKLQARGVKSRELS
jgi:hypothetical protein